MSEWINVGIKYPECHVNVLLTDGVNVAFGYRVADKNHNHWKSHQNLGWITHWMALPEPPLSLSITCPKCKLTSYNLNDIKYEFCGNCHEWHERMKLQEKEQ